MTARPTFRERYGPWAVVTGASSGIGAALAEEAARLGLDVVLVARRREVLVRLAADLEAAHEVSTRVVPLDLASAGRNELDEATADLDVGLFVAAAGFGTSGDFLTADLAVELEMLQVNGAAVCTQTHQFGRRFAARGRGGIVLLGSIVGFQGMPNAAHYAATKAYIQVFGEGLAHECRPHGVDVLTVAPGPTASGFGERAGMQMGSASRPDRLAQPILHALGRRSTLLPDMRATFLRGAVLGLPRRGRVRVMGAVMRGMTGGTAPHD